MAPPMWAFCPLCSRWYYVGSERGRTPEAISCPVCRTAPSDLVDDAQPVASSAEETPA